MVMSCTKKYSVIIVNVVVIGLLLCGQYYVQQENVHAKDLITSHAEFVKEEKQEIEGIKKKLSGMKQVHEFEKKNVESLNKVFTLAAKEKQEYMKDAKAYIQKITDTGIKEVQFGDEDGKDCRITFDPESKKFGYYVDEKQISNDAIIRPIGDSELDVTAKVYETHKPIQTPANKKQVSNTVNQIENYRQVWDRLFNEKEEFAMGKDRIGKYTVLKATQVKKDPCHDSETLLTLDEGTEFEIVKTTATYSTYSKKTSFGYVQEKGWVPIMDWAMDKHEKYVQPKDASQIRRMNSIDQLYDIFAEIKKDLGLDSTDEKVVISKTDDGSLTYHVSLKEYRYNNTEYRNLFMELIDDIFTLKLQKFDNIGFVIPKKAEAKAIINQVKEFNLIPRIESSILLKQKEINHKKQAIAREENKLAEKQTILAEKQTTLEEKQTTLEEKQKAIQEAENDVEAKKSYQTVMWIVIVFFVCLTIILLIFFNAEDDDGQDENNDKDEEDDDEEEKNFNYLHGYSMV